MTPQEILKNAKSILVIDWPSKEVPESLARAGYRVMVKGGPGPQDYSAYEMSEGQVTVRRTGAAPDHVDVVYTYRPLGELPGIIALAQSLGAKTIWTQSGCTHPGVEDNPKGCWLPEEDLRKAQAMITAAGMAHIAAPYIVDVIRGCDLTRS